MSHFPELRLNRRRLAGLVGATGVLPLLDLRGGSAAAQEPPAGSPAPSRRHRLRRERGSVVSALDLPLGGGAAAGLARSRGGVRTQVIETDGFAMAGLTWRSGNGTVRARFRRPRGGWTEWQRLEELTDGPEQGEDARGRRATELVWAGWSDAIQVQVPEGLREPELALIAPGEDAADAIDSDDLRAGEEDEAQDVGVLGRTAARSRPPRPGMRSRGRWGAPKGGGSLPRTKNIRQMHVHHTVSTNNYRKRDVPGMIRGMHRYHTRNLGWSDIGYNFLVDKYGRIWVGRRGSVWKETRGAHTRGFNNTSFGVAVIGNHQQRRPNDQVLHGLKRLASWKLAQHGRNPTGMIWVRSEGSDKYPAGKGAHLPVIDGHRHTSSTACPGWFLYRELPRLRRMTKRRIRRFR
ncbi:N-acetylmuramoyl-L-alanine amidase [Nocardioides panacisoli]|uniref:N-acetylmuramoyl-L-alanine amidase n=1 Tax=Nocardioides panacisoli TaxID=627624 RepID=UPI001C62EFAD|nr:N-acetylmuramoyl-L-alanine amidase [Nocardioides panacisoli]QYJ04332.1 N-acetylmuramoyl-L-alanine amidase [Nocardioides panacisoli]